MGDHHRRPSIVRLLAVAVVGAVVCGCDESPRNPSPPAASSDSPTPPTTTGSAKATVEPAPPEMPESVRPMFLARTAADRSGPLIMVEAVRVEPNAYRGDRSGTAFHVRVRADRSAGKALRIWADIFDEQGRPAPGKLFFRNAEGHLAASSSQLDPAADPELFDDVRLFVPYDAMPAGTRFGYLVAGSLEDGPWITQRPMWGEFRMPR